MPDENTAYIGFNVIYPGIFETPNIPKYIFMENMFYNV